MGVASLEAADRFSTTAAQLASLAVLQLVVYAGMQIPVGILLDRFGPRAMLSIGAVVMAFGQLIVASAVSLDSAIFGRMLVGMGDAFTFISMIRMSNNWLSGRQAARAQQWLATIGQLGQILSAVPFAYLLHVSGWYNAFFTLALFGGCVAVLVFVAARDSATPGEHTVESIAIVWRTLRRNIKRPSVQMAFWTHFTTQSSGTVFALLWGVPFLVQAQGKSPAYAATVLTVFVLTNASLGPLIGNFTAKYPERRLRFLIAVTALIILAWVIVLAWQGIIPDWLGFALVVAIGVGGPTSMIAFDFSRSYVIKSELGVTNGFINIGGFLASLSMMALIGFVLDYVHDSDLGSQLYSTNGFRAAFATQFLILAVGLAGLLSSARKTAKSELVLS
jgi:MFS family permease